MALFWDASRLTQDQHRHSQKPPTMREVISIHVGQAGVQIGNACCEYLCPRLSSRSIRSLSDNALPTGELYTIEHGLTVCFSSSCDPAIEKIVAYIPVCSLTVASSTKRRSRARAMVCQLSFPRRAPASMSRALSTSTWSQVLSTRSRLAPIDPFSTRKQC